MPLNQQGEVTTLLAEIRSGDESAKDRLFSLVYDELHEVAERRMARERSSHTWQPTDLMNEVIAKLLPGDALAKGVNRRWFFGVAIKSMKCALIDHARKRDTAKRGGEWSRVPLDINLGEDSPALDTDILDLTMALEQLEALNEQQCNIVELRYFGGFTMKEIAEHLDVSLSTVEKDLRVARAWLYSRLSDGD